VEDLQLLVGQDHVAFEHLAVAQPRAAVDAWLAAYTSLQFVDGDTGKVAWREVEAGLETLLAIHESIEDSQAMQGYEGLPLQVEQIYWEVWGVLARNPDLTTTEEVMDQWMDDCIGGMHLNWEDPVTQ
jgi:hypothetical protein